MIASNVSTYVSFFYFLKNTIGDGFNQKGVNLPIVKHSAMFVLIANLTLFVTEKCSYFGVWCIVANKFRMLLEFELLVAKV